MRKSILLMAVVGLVVLMLVYEAKAQTSTAPVPAGSKVELLWPDGAPGAAGTEDADKPSLTICLPPKDRATGGAVVVCPGGAYVMLAMDHEGKQVAEWLNSIGVAAFILKYRLAPRYRHPAMMQDVQRAIRIVRARGTEWGIEPEKIGVLGFSAGGHLASTAATHFDDGDAQASDPVDRVSCRPDAAILVYPVITFTEPTMHSGSKRNLLGENPDPQLVESMSNEKQVTARTPPTFLVHTNADTGVPPENSILFYLALRKAGVPAEMHIYEKGPHGFGLGSSKGPRDPVLATWPGHCTDWLRLRGIARPVPMPAPAPTPAPK